MIGDWKRISWKEHLIALVWMLAVGSYLGWASGSAIIGGALSAVSRKLAFGDFDVGYAWTFSDIVFWVTSFLQGAVGGAIGQYLRVRERATQAIDEVAVKTYGLVSALEGAKKQTETVSSTLSA